MRLVVVAVGRVKERSTRAVIGDGGVLEMGSHDELVALGGVYADMYAVWEQHSRTGTRPA